MTRYNGEQCDIFLERKEGSGYAAGPSLPLKGEPSQADKAECTCHGIVRERVQEVAEQRLLIVLIALCQLEMAASNFIFS